MKSIVLENLNGINYSHIKKLYKSGTIGYIDFPIFAIYQNPSDYPDKFVVRIWQIKGKLGKPTPTPYCIVRGNLEECREALPPRLHRFGKDSSDDPVIIETWI